MEVSRLALFANAGAMCDKFALEAHIDGVIEQYLPDTITVYPPRLEQFIRGCGWQDDITVWVRRSALQAAMAPKGRLRVQRNRLVNLVCNSLVPPPDRLVILWSGSHLGVLGEQLRERASNSGIPTDVLRLWPYSDDEPEAVLTIG